MLNTKTDKILLYICLISTFLSQTPFLLKLGYNNFIFSFWLVPFIRHLFFYNYKIYINPVLKNILFFSILFYVIIFFIGINFNTNYLYSAVIRNYVIVLFLLIIGYNYGNYVSLKSYEKILINVALISGLILFSTIMYEISKTNFLYINVREYLYKEKNSAAQILLNILIILSVKIKSHNKILYFINYFVIILLVILILILRSRTTILCLFIIYLYFLIKYKNKYVIKLSLFLLALLYNKINFIFNYFILAGRNVKSINDFTSGREYLYNKFPSLFLENIFFGRGVTNFESFPLSILAEYGLILSLPIFIFLYQPISFIKNNTIDSKLTEIFLLFICTIYINGLFENQAPFGPGVKSFIIWFLFGFLLNYNFKKSYFK